LFREYEGGSKNFTSKCRVSFCRRCDAINVFQFAIPASKVAPERLVQTCDKLSLNAAKLYVFQWTDIKSSREPETEMYVIVNNEQTVRGDPLSICENYGINAIPFLKLDSITDRIKA
jgi:hypothetical protein